MKRFLKTYWAEVLVVGAIFGVLLLCTADCFQEDGSVAFRAGDIVMTKALWQAKLKNGVNNGWYKSRLILLWKL